MKQTACARCGEEISHVVSLRLAPDGTRSDQARAYGYTCADIVRGLAGVPRKRASRGPLWEAWKRSPGGEWVRCHIVGIDVRASMEPAIARLQKRPEYAGFEFELRRKGK